MPRNNRRGKYPYRLGPGYIVWGKTRDDRNIMEQTIVAEHALGRCLPPGAVVHHVNGVRDDNRPGNLVICQDKAYHMLLHARARALAVAGSASLLQCIRCRRWDLRDRVIQDGRGHRYVHRACRTAHQKRLYRQRVA